MAHVEGPICLRLSLESFLPTKVLGRHFTVDSRAKHFAAQFLGHSQPEVSRRSGYEGPHGAGFLLLRLARSRV